MVGERIVCPFHAWEYDTSGVCARIPYLDGKIPPGARVPALPVIEHLGWIWLYHGEKPAFELPDMPEARDPRFWIHHKTQRFRMHPLVILENAAGLRHFRTVHRVDAKNIQWEILREEPHCFEFVVTQEVPTRRGSTVVMTQFLYPGASAIFGSLKVGRRLLARFIAAPMPVSREEIAFHLIVIGKGLPGYRRLLNPLYRWYLARKLYKGSTDDYGPVWQHQNPHRRKVLVEEDRLQQKFRQYYRSQLPGSRLAQAS